MHFEGVVQAEGENTRQRHAAGPACGDQFGIGAFFGDPAPKDAIAFGVQLGFLRVVGAVVEHASFLRVEEELFRIEFANFPNHLAGSGI